jgi:Mn2+/Fe2+ NRAMP family transporter
VNAAWLRILSYAVAFFIAILNVWLIAQLLTGGQ